MNDPRDRVLGRLPRVEPDPVNAARVRARCRETLERRNARRQPLRPAPPGMWERAIAALSLVYLTEVVRQALRLSGIL